MSIWILVANRASARIFEQVERGTPPVPLAEFHHPEGRLHEGDLVTDRGAAVFQSAGKGQNRATGPEVEATTKESETFASALCEHLRDARIAGGYDRLILVAAPSFLGELRKHLDAATRKLVLDEVDKNLADQSPRDLEGPLTEILREARAGVHPR